MNDQFRGRDSSTYLYTSSAQKKPDTNLYLLSLEGRKKEMGRDGEGKREKSNG